MHLPPTLILSAAEVGQALPLPAAIAAVEDSFRLAAAGRLRLPPVVHIPASGGGVHVKSAARVEGPAQIAVKVNANFPGNPSRGLPTIQGAVLLCDGENGRLLAILESGALTAIRTAAASAVAARHLAAADASVATLVGCGVQGPLQIRALLEVLPLRSVYLHDLDPERAQAVAQMLAAHGRLRTIVTDDLRAATLESDVVVTATTASRPFLGPGDLRPGAFVAAVGADHPEKHELHPELLAAGRVVVDVLDQCAEIGELHHALVAGCMERGQVAGSLQEIVAGTLDLKRRAEDIVIFDSTGTATQDVLAAGAAYEGARASSIGRKLQL